MIVEASVLSRFIFVTLDSDSVTVDVSVLSDAKLVRTDSDSVIVDVSVLSDAKLVRTDSDSVTVDVSVALGTNAVTLDCFVNIPEELVVVVVGIYSVADELTSVCVPQTSIVWPTATAIWNVALPLSTLVEHETECLYQSFPTNSTTLDPPITVTCETPAVEITPVYVEIFFTYPDNV